jgi:2,3-bisphosphoglycerate-dependent phosphoglycerate mutase
MRKFFLTFLICSFYFTASTQTTTIVLFRHAEKDTTQTGSTMMQADPPLAAAGHARAAQLPALFQKFHFTGILSTNFIRTRSTAAPLATKHQLTVQLYNHKNLQNIADSLLNLENHTIAVVGHSNSTPALVNLLIKENKFAALDESVYNVYWVVTIKDKKTTATQYSY